MKQLASCVHWTSRMAHSCPEFGKVSISPTVRQNVLYIMATCIPIWFQNIYALPRLSQRENNLRNVSQVLLDSSLALTPQDLFPNSGERPKLRPEYFRTAYPAFPGQSMLLPKQWDVLKLVCPSQILHPHLITYLPSPAHHWGCLQLEIQNVFPSAKLLHQEGSTKNHLQFL